MPMSYLIVGSGVFGASTALYLIRKHPDATITLVDRDAHDAPTRVAASWDWNKLVRAEYRDIRYAELALEAQSLWRSDPIWRPFYHESGVFWVSPSDFGQKSQENFRKLGAVPDTYSLSVEAARKLHGGLFEGGDYSRIDSVHFNKSSGFAEAKEALQSTIQAAIDLGVKYATAEVVGLKLEAKRCYGIKTESGIMSADRIVLCTGAFTPALLARSEPTWKELHAAKRIMAAGVAEAVAIPPAELEGILRGMPAAVSELPEGDGYDFGVLPVPKDGTLKIWSQWIFRNTTEHPDTGAMSIPPSAPDYNQWAVPTALKQDIELGLQTVLGNKLGIPQLEHARLCWDALTPSQDFIISPHSACEGLYVATCGSFHGFKFLPVLGKYVVAMLDNELDPELQRKWAWDRDLPPTYERDNVKWPKRELRDF